MVEDEKYIARATAEVLKKNYYTVDLAHDGEYGLDCALSGVYDVIILDIMLPKLDGLSILGQLRGEGIATPVILLTARGEIGDKVRGLDLGADDYLPKPFHADELLARIRALYRRREKPVSDTLSYADITLSPHTLTLCCGEESERLTLKQSQLIELFIANKGQILSKDLIIEKIWGYDADADDSNVEAHVSMLRSRLKKLGSRVEIKAIRGIGYTMNGEKH